MEPSGASQVHIADELTGGKLELGSSGAGSIDGTIRFDEADVEMSGGSQGTLEGTAGRLVVQESGASQPEAEQLQVGDLTIQLSGASQATVSVTDHLLSLAAGLAPTAADRGLAQNEVGLSERRTEEGGWPWSPAHRRG